MISIGAVSGSDFGAKSDKAGRLALGGTHLGRAMARFKNEDIFAAAAGLGANRGKFPGSGADERGMTRKIFADGESVACKQLFAEPNCIGPGNPVSGEKRILEIGAPF